MLYHKFALILFVAIFCVFNAVLATTEKIVYSTDESGNYDIWVMNPDGSMQTKLFDSPEDDVAPQISHDGRFVAFVRMTTMPYNGNIYTYDMLTKQIRQVTNTGNVAGDLSWSPDDSQISFKNVCYYYAARICKADVLTGTETILTPNCDNGIYSTVWHPTDNYIYFINHKTCGWGVFRVPTDGGSIEREDTLAFHTEVWQFNPINPDIVVSLSRKFNCWSGPNYLYKYNLTTGVYDTLFYGSDSTYSGFPTWSPDGAEIAFTSNFNDNVGIYKIDTLTKTEVFIANTYEYNLWGLDWGVTVLNDSLLTDSLLFPSISLLPCDDECVAQPAMVNLSQPITGATIPFKIPESVEFCDISTSGLLTENWVMEVYVNPDDSSERAVGLWNMVGDLIPAGTTTVFNILFTTERECEFGKFIQWDTAFMGDPQHELLFSDTNHYDLQAEFDPSQNLTEIPGYEPGNVDGIIGPFDPYDVADLSCLVSSIYMGNDSCICVLNAGDLNGSCTGPNIADITYLIATLYLGGPAPLCGCLGEGGVYKISNDIIVQTQYQNDITTITLNSPVDLRGLQVTLAGDGVPAPVSLADSKLELLSGSNTIGLVDLQGEAVIKSGTRNVIQIPGKYEITEAIASDMNHHDVMLSINANKQSALPKDYSLSQNYPNPFNPTTEISFSLPNAGEVRLEVFNVIGQKVVTLVNDNLEAGTHTIRWDSRDASGNPVSSGIYLYRLEAGQFVDTKKMMLLK